MSITAPRETGIPSLKGTDLGRKTGWDRGNAARAADMKFLNREWGNMTGKEWAYVTTELVGVGLAGVALCTACGVAVEQIPSNFQSPILFREATPSEETAYLSGLGPDPRVAITQPDGTVAVVPIEGVALISDYTQLGSDSTQHIQIAQFGVSVGSSVDSWAFEKNGEVKQVLMQWAANEDDIKAGRDINAVAYQMEADPTGLISLSRDAQGNLIPVGRALIPTDSSVSALVEVENPFGEADLKFNIQQVMGSILSWGVLTAEAAEEGAITATPLAPTATTASTELATPVITATSTPLPATVNPNGTLTVTLQPTAVRTEAPASPTPVKLVLPEREGRQYVSGGFELGTESPMDLIKLNEKADLKAIDDQLNASFAHSLTLPENASVWASIVAEHPEWAKISNSFDYPFEVRLAAVNAFLEASGGWMVIKQFPPVAIGLPRLELVDLNQPKMFQCVEVTNVNADNKLLDLLPGMNLTAMGTYVENGRMVYREEFTDKFVNDGRPDYTLAERCTVFLLEIAEAVGSQRYNNQAIWDSARKTIVSPIPFVWDSQGNAYPLEGLNGPEDNLHVKTVLVFK